MEGIADFAGSTLVHEDSISVDDLKGKEPQQIKEYLNELAQEDLQYESRSTERPEQLLEFEKVVILRVVDSKWTDHIDAMDQLRQSIGLRAYGQNNPLVEYQTEGYKMFEDMVGAIEYEVTRIFMKAEIRQNVQREQVSQGEAVQPTTGDAKENSNTNAKKQPVM